MSGQRVFISCIHAERYRVRWNRLVLRKLWGTGRPSPRIYPRIAGDFYIYAGAVQCPHLQYICDSGIYEQEPLSQADKDALLGETMEQEIILEARNITKVYPGGVVNHNVNLQIKKGEIHALVGENGAGKSTLMKMLFGMLAPTEGQIFVNRKRGTLLIIQRCDRGRTRHGTPAFHAGSVHDRCGEPDSRRGDRNCI